MAVFTQVCFNGTLDSKGRVTVPARIRNRLQLKKGDEVSLKIRSQRTIRKEFSSKRDALNFLSGLDGVKSFSFNGKVLEVIIDG